MHPNELERHPVLNWTQAREGRLHTVTLGLHHRLTRQVLSLSSTNFAFHPNDMILRLIVITDTDLDSMMKKDLTEKFRHDFSRSNGVKFKCVASIYDAYYKVTICMPSR